MYNCFLILSSHIEIIHFLSIADPLTIGINDSPTLILYFYTYKFGLRQFLDRGIIPLIMIHQLSFVRSYAQPLYIQDW